MLGVQLSPPSDAAERVSGAFSVARRLVCSEGTVELSFMVSLQFWFPFYSPRDRWRMQAATLRLLWAWNGAMGKTPSTPTRAIPCEFRPARQYQGKLLPLGTRRSKTSSQHSPRPVPFSGPRSRIERPVCQIKIMIDRRLIKNHLKTVKILKMSKLKHLPSESSTIDQITLTDCPYLHEQTLKVFHVII